MYNESFYKMKRLYFSVFISISIISHMADAQPGKLDYIKRPNLKGSALSNNNVPLVITNPYTYVHLHDVYISKLVIQNSQGNNTYDLSSTPLYAQYTTDIDTSSTFSLYPNFIYWMVTNAMGAYNIRHSTQLHVVDTDNIFISLCYIQNLTFSKITLTPGYPTLPALTSLISYGNGRDISHNNLYFIHVMCSDTTQTCDLVSNDASKNLYIYFPENVDVSPTYPSGYAYGKYVSTSACTSRLN